MYGFVLNVHSWLRWVVIIAMLWTILRAVLPGRRDWTPADDRSMRLSLVALDVQFLLGLLLYFVLSPFTRQAMSDMGAAMKSSGLRFFAVEHVLGMVIGITLAHVGAARIKKAAPQRRHRLAAIYFVLALLAVLASIPWPGLPAGRPLFRLWGA